MTFLTGSIVRMGQHNIRRCAWLAVHSRRYLSFREAVYHSQEHRLRLPESPSAAFGVKRRENCRFART
jgi:hypothetical protein